MQRRLTPASCGRTASLEAPLATTKVRGAPSGSDAATVPTGEPTATFSSTENEADEATHNFCYDLLRANMLTMQNEAGFGWKEAEIRGQLRDEAADLRRQQRVPTRLRRRPSFSRGGQAILL